MKMDVMGREVEIPDNLHALEVRIAFLETERLAMAEKQQEILTSSSNSRLSADKTARYQAHLEMAAISAEIKTLKAWKSIAETHVQRRLDRTSIVNSRLLMEDDSVLFIHVCRLMVTIAKKLGHKRLSELVSLDEYNSVLDILKMKLNREGYQYLVNDEATRLTAAAQLPEEYNMSKQAMKIIDGIRAGKI